MEHCSVVLVSRDIVDTIDIIDVYYLLKGKYSWTGGTNFTVRTKKSFLSFKLYLSLKRDLVINYKIHCSPSHLSAIFKAFPWVKEKTAIWSVDGKDISNFLFNSFNVSNERIFEIDPYLYHHLQGFCFCFSSLSTTTKSLLSSSMSMQKPINECQQAQFMKFWSIWVVPHVTAVLACFKPPKTFTLNSWQNP